MLNAKVSQRQATQLAKERFLAKGIDPASFFREDQSAPPDRILCQHTHELCIRGGSKQ